MMKSKSNKRKLASVIGTFNLAEITSVKKMIVDFFLVKLTLQLRQSGQSVTCIVSDDTDVFVLLLHWVNWADMQGKVQMKL